MPRRLHIGASRLEHLEAQKLEMFLDRTWVHLGEVECDELGRPRTALSRLVQGVRTHGPLAATRKALGAVPALFLGAAGHQLTSDEIRARTDFRKFYYQKGDTLDFEASTFDYVFSEHFFEHVFLDEAISLMRECHRVLKPFGVIRTCVPDADLRLYEPPEPLGFPDRHLRFDHPDKHKTRWSVYSLSEALVISGFEPFPLRYCDKHGNDVSRRPADHRESYAGSQDLEMVLDLGHIVRTDSLIVDGIKRT